MKDEELAVDEVVDPLLEESAPSEEVLEPENSETPKEVEAKEPDSKGFQKRIDKRTGDYYREKNRADVAERKLADFESKGTQDVGEEPTLEKFDYDEAAYNKALAKHYANEAVAKVQQTNAQTNQKSKVDQIIKDYDQKVAKLGGDDFYNKVNVLAEQKILGPGAYEVIMTDENGPLIELHLASNLELAGKIGQMPLGPQARELGKLSVNLSRTPTKKTTTAPVPIKTAGSGGVSTKDLTNASMDEIMASNL